MQNINNLCMGCMKDNGGELRCHICGYMADAPQDAPLLPLRTWLEDRYLVGRAIESNGEGNTYIGWDNVLQAPVRIREFLPGTLATRTPGTLSVCVKSGCEYYFSDYLASFQSLARGLARMRELPALFPVYDIFEANGTTYYVSEQVESITLSSFLDRNGGTITWDQAKTVLMPVLSTVNSLHEADVFHGGISPDTMLVCRDGKIRLSGFCIAEARVTRSEIEAELFSGYAAAEQYGADEVIGARADVYAFAATLFRVLVGSCPPDAPSRISNDRLIIPARVAQMLPQEVIEALTQALQIMPADRLPSADRFRFMLTGSRAVAKMRTSDITRNEGDKVQEWNNEPKKPHKNSNIAYAVFALIITVAIALILLVVFFSNIFKSDKNDTSSVASQETSSVTSTQQETSSKSGIFQNTVPDIEKAKYADICEQYGADFDIVITDVEYSNDFARGTILTQSPSKETLLYENDRNDEGKYVINITISLGSQTTTMPNLSNQTKDEAIYSLLKNGFDYNNIEVQERYDPDVGYQKVVDTEPAAGTKNVDKNSKIIIYIQNNPDSASSNQ